MGQVNFSHDGQITLCNLNQVARLDHILRTGLDLDAQDIKTIQPSTPVSATPTAAPALSDLKPQDVFTQSSSYNKVSSPVLERNSGSASSSSSSSTSSTPSRSAKQSRRPDNQIQKSPAIEAPVVKTKAKSGVCVLL